MRVFIDNLVECRRKRDLVGNGRKTKYYLKLNMAYMVAECRN